MAETQTSSAPSASPMPADELRLQDMANKWLKARLADHLRLMKDNQKILDTTASEDRALRDQRHRLREHQLGRVTGQQGGIQYPEDSMGDILIDSPRTENHHYPAPAQQQPFIGTLGKTLLAGALTLGAGSAGYLANAWLNKPAQQPTVTNTTTTSKEGFLIELIPATKDK